MTKSAISFLLFLSLLNVLKKSIMKVQYPVKPAIKEPFTMKIVSYLIASPEEVANTLVDEKVRHLWDPNVKSVVKKDEDNL